MNEFNTNYKVIELLRDKEGVGRENLYFLAINDLTKVMASETLILGAGVDLDYTYDAVLFNKSEYGIGLFFIIQSQFHFFKCSKEGFILDDNKYLFIPNSDILKFTVKNSSIFNKRVKRICIKIRDGKEHNLFVNVNEPLLPYHKDNFAKFLEQYNNINGTNL